MYRHRISTALTTSIVLLATRPSPAEPICRPHISVKAVRMSEVQNLQRTWTATLNVDARRCTADSGRFDIHFLREKENAPELAFSESFTWHTGKLGVGQVAVSIDLWIDETVHDYRIYIVPCACRD
jgi:hypothetical protein